LALFSDRFLHQIDEFGAQREWRLFFCHNMLKGFFIGNALIDQTGKRVKIFIGKIPKNCVAVKFRFVRIRKFHKTNPDFRNTGNQRESFAGMC